MFACPGLIFYTVCSVPWLNGNLALAEKSSGPLRFRLRQVLLYICCAIYDLDNKASPSFIVYQADCSGAWYGLQNQEVLGPSEQPVLERKIPLALLLEHNTSLTKVKLSAVCKEDWV